MGLCSSAVVRSHLDLLDAASAQDYDCTLLIFSSLKLKKNVSKSFLQLYEACCDQGKGSLKYLHRAFRINKNDEYFFDKTFLYFQDDVKHHRTFTCPQFCIMLWQFLSCDAEGLSMWMFRVYFGGPSCAHHLYATQNEVFHVLDILYGVSKAHDYRPGSKFIFS